MSTRSPAPTAPSPDHAERPVGLVPGTRDCLPGDCVRLSALETVLLDGFRLRRVRADSHPVLEYTELHQRKSGAGIVSKLFELDDGPMGTCLRPELTASIVRAYTEAAACPPLPWRVCMAGPVFRRESEANSDRLKLREFTQVGVEMLGAGGPDADAEVIALADRSLAEAGLPDATIRIGHVGLIVEILEGTGLPSAACSALVEILSAAAADGGRVVALESALDRLEVWLNAGGDADAIIPAVSQADDRGVRPALSPPGARRDRAPIGSRDHPPDATEVGPRPLARRNPGKSPRPGPRPRRVAWAGARRPGTARGLDGLGGPAIDRRPARAGRPPGGSRHRDGPGRARPGVRSRHRVLFPDDLRAGGCDGVGSGRGLRWRPVRRARPGAGQRSRRPWRRVRRGAGAAGGTQPAGRPVRALESRRRARP